MPVAPLHSNDLPLTFPDLILEPIAFPKAHSRLLERYVSEEENKLKDPIYSMVSLYMALSSPKGRLIQGLHKPIHCNCAESTFTLVYAETFDGN